MLKLVFKNWAQFGEFMDSLNLELSVDENLKFENADGFLNVFWENTSAVPNDSLVNHTVTWDQQ